VFITTGYGVGCVTLRIQQDKGKWRDPSPVWQPTKAMGCKFSSPVSHEGSLYGLDEGVLACVDEKDGHQVWREGRYGHGQLLLTGDLLVILAENGDLALVEAKPEAFHELGKMHVLEGVKTWNYPALANGRVYVRNHEEMACYDLTTSAKP
jgi:outer membrane protein assembly factor BamB